MRFKNHFCQMTGNTGVRLQYTHCRLKSLHKKSGLATAPACDPSMLSETAAINLVYEISRFVHAEASPMASSIGIPTFQGITYLSMCCRFDEVLHKSFKDLEASKLAEYLFSLW